MIEICRNPVDRTAKVAVGYPGKEPRIYNFTDEDLVEIAEFVLRDKIRSLETENTELRYRLDNIQKESVNEEKYKQAIKAMCELYLLA